MSSLPVETPASGTAAQRSGDLLHNSFVLVVSYVVTRFVGFITIIWLARVLGPTGFGAVTLAQAILVYPTLLTHLGLMTLGTKEVAQGSYPMAFLVRNIVRTRALMSLLAYLLLIGGSYLMPVAPATKWLLIVFGLSLLPYSLTLDWVFKGMQRMTIVGIVEVFRTVPYFILVAVFVRRPEHEMRVGLLYSLAIAMAAVFSLLEYRRSQGTLSGPTDLNFCRKSLRAAIPLGIAFVMVQVYYLTDTVLLGFLKNETMVGLYAAAYKTIAFLQGVGGWYFEAVFPVLALFSKFAPDRLQKLARSAIHVVVLGLFPIAVGGSILAEPMMVAFYGQQYAAAAVPFRILLWAISIALVGMLFGYGLMAADRTKQYLISVTCGAATSVVLNLLLIPKYGTMGASVARLASEVVIAILFFVFFQSVVNTRISDLFTESAFASVVMAVTVYFAPWHWVARMLLGAVTYFAALVVISRLTNRPWYGPLKEIRALGTTLDSVS